MKSWTSRPVPQLPGAMPAVRLFDTAQDGPVTLDAAGEQSMYVCGITPYDATHMGRCQSTPP